MEPNPVRRPTILDVVQAVIALFILLPCSVFYRITRWFFSSKPNRSPLNEVLGRSLFVSLAVSIPISIIQYIGTVVGGGSDVLTSRRYRKQRGQIFERVQRKDFAGHWICRGLGQEPIDPRDAHICVLYMHGGAYILGWPALDAPALLLMAEEAARDGLSMACFSLEYSLAPRACMPVQVNQARAAYRWLVKDQGVPTSRITLMGESSGGHLAVSLLTNLHLESVKMNGSAESRKLGKPGFAFLLGPWLDLYNSNSKCREVDDFETAFRRFLNKSAHMVLRTTPVQYRGIIENFVASVKGRGSWVDILPKTTWVSGGSGERIFIEDIIDFVSQAKSEGANITLEIHKGGPHAWQNAEARPARKQFLASGADVDDGTVMPGYRVVAKALIRAYKESTGQ